MTESEGKVEVGRGKDGVCYRVNNSTIMKVVDTPRSAKMAKVLSTDFRKAGVDAVRVKEVKGSRYYMDDLSDNGANHVVSWPDLYISPYREEKTRILRATMPDLNQRVARRFFQNLQKNFAASVNAKLPYVFSSCMLVVGRNSAKTVIADYEDVLHVGRGLDPRSKEHLKKITDKYIREVVLLLCPHWEGEAEKSIYTLEEFIRQQ